MHSSPTQENWAGFDEVCKESETWENAVQRPEWTANELRMRDSVMRGKAMTPVVRHNILNIGLSACALLLPPIAALASVFTMHPVQDNDAPHEERASRSVPYYFSLATCREQSVGKNLPCPSSPVQLAPDNADERGSEPDSSRATLQPMAAGELFHAPHAMTSVGLASQEVVRNKMRTAHKTAKPRLRIHRGTFSSV